jgi:O-acetyl-ADP-ribose deacetylase (regulator of RNase III)
MKIIKGNLIKLAVSGEAKIIVHGCNCFHAMGSGIAGNLARQFPEIPLADYQTDRGDISKLATYSRAHVTKRLSPLTKLSGNTCVPLDSPFTCINLYTQYIPGPDFLPSLFSEGLRRLNKDFQGETLWFPLIGCGIGGGNWTDVMNEMLVHLRDVDVRVVVL